MGKVDIVLTPTLIKDFEYNGSFFSLSKWPVSFLSGGRDSFIKRKNKVYQWVYKLVCRKGDKIEGHLYLPDEVKSFNCGGCGETIEIPACDFPKSPKKKMYCMECFNEKFGEMING